MMLSARASQGGRELREPHVLPAGGPADALTPAQDQPAGPALVLSMAALLPSHPATAPHPSAGAMPVAACCGGCRPKALPGFRQGGSPLAPVSVIIIIRFSHDELFNGLWSRRKGVSWEWMIYCCYSALFLPSLLSELSHGNHGLMPSYLVCGARSPHLPTRQLPPSPPQPPLHHHHVLFCIHCYLVR